MKNTKILVVVDESPATSKALMYVAQMAAGRRKFRVCLAHSLLAPPHELVEFRGAEKGRLAAYKSRWISADAMTEQRALERANAVLRGGGLGRGNRSSLLLSGGRKACNQSNCGTCACAEMPHGRHWKKIAFMASWNHSGRPCRGTCPSGKRIHNLGRGLKSMMRRDEECRRALSSAGSALPRFKRRTR